MAHNKTHASNVGSDPVQRLQPLVYRYDEEEWLNVILPDPDWSRKETDYLLDLCELFRLRFIHIADRYQACACLAGRST